MCKKVQGNWISFIATSHCLCNTIEWDNSVMKLYYPENDAYCCYSEVPEEIVCPPSRKEIKLEAGIQVSNLLG